MADGNTILLTSLVESTEHHDNYTVTSFMVGGEQHGRNLVGAVEESYNRPDEIDWEALVGKKVTFLRVGENMLGATMLTATEGTVFKPANSACDYAYLPKGKRTKGFGIRRDTVLDVVEGYDVARLALRVAETVARLPELAPLTKERLEQLPRPTDERHGCTLGVLYHWLMSDDAETYRGVWMVESYEPEDDICDGVLLVPEQVGTSEHGSITGTDLLRRGALIVGFQPVSFAEAVELTDVPFEEAFGRITAASRAVRA